MQPFEEIGAETSCIQHGNNARAATGHANDEISTLPEEPRWLTLGDCTVRKLSAFNDDTVESLPKKPRWLTLGACTSHNLHSSNDTVEHLVELMRIATETQIEKSLTKHHGELLSNMRALMHSSGRDDELPEEANNTVSKSGNDKKCVTLSGHVVERPCVISQQSDIDAPHSGDTDEFEDAEGGFESSNPQLAHQLSRQQSRLSRARVSVTSVAKDIVNSQRPLEQRIVSEMTKVGSDDPLRRNNDTHLRRVLRHPVFELAMGMMVSSNSIFIGWEIEYMTAYPGRVLPPMEFIIISYLYTTVFVIELLLRLVANWWAFLWDSDAKSLAWNYLDILIVASSLVEVGLDIITFQGASGGGDIDLSNLRVIRMVRVFRLIRLLRIARFVRFVRALRMLVYSILCTLKSVFWAMVLMAVIIYVFAILFTQATVSYTSIESLVPIITNLERYWGSIGSSMFSLFMSISGGISWGEVVEPLGEISVIWKILFLTYIYFTYFAILNVVTGIFCQAALESCSEDHDSMLQTVLRHKELYTARFMEIFKEIDEDGSGRITLQEFIVRMEDEEVKDYFASLELNCADALCLFDLFDDAENIGIRVEEFVMGCLRLKGTARSSDMVRLLHENRQLMDYLDSILDHLQIGSTEKEGSPIRHALTTGVFNELSATAKSILRASRASEDPGPLG